MAASALLVAPITPPEYHRIISPTLRVNQDPKIPIPVGILACQRYRHLPEGGGQPTDTGIIKTADGTVWDVIQAKRHGGHAVHYVRVPSTTAIDAALISFSPGANVIASLDQAGWDRRYDHMSMHTSQHLLSALMETRLNLPTLSWSLTSYPSPCYVEVPRGMTLEEITFIQAEANRLVFEGRNIHIEVEELDQEKDHSKVVTLESGRAVGKGLPDDYTGGVKRVVVIDGVDSNPCCGTHLPSIKNLQLFLVPHTEALSRSSTTSARLYFLSGPRLITYLASTHGLLTSTSSVLSCGAPLVPERVSQLVDERRKADKRAQDVESELANLLAQGLVSEASQSDGLFKRHIHRIDDSGNVLGFLSMIGLLFADQLKTLAVTTDYLLIFSSSPSAQTQSSTSVVVVFGSKDELVKQGGDALKVKQGVKGGGKGARWSGKATGVWKESNNTSVAEILATL
ncbi:ThrRS/AlaRS common domain-containing protein [Hymenopellis radicata]|nr:ThrRS/AlaRS common domain-containing protein [Hymenopellis radicata]